jgi:hypothetical protein
MKINIIGGLLVAALAITSLANAQDKTPVVNARQHNQEHRINNGVKSGELTRNETRHVRNDERRIRSEKRIAKASGHVTHKQRTMLRHQENRTSRTIYRDKHNNKVRG